MTCRPAKELVLSKEKPIPYQPPLPPNEAPSGVDAAAGVTPVGLRPSFVTPAAAHSHPDCRGIPILIVALDGHPFDDGYDYPYGYGEYAQYGPWAYNGYYGGGYGGCYLARQRVWTLAFERGADLRLNSPGRTTGRRIVPYLSVRGFRYQAPSSSPQRASTTNRSSRRQWR